MAVQKFHVDGLRELETALKELPKATGKNVLKRVLVKAAAPVASSAERLAPRMRGRLQMSIGTGTKLSRRQSKLHRKESAVEVFVGAGALVQAITQEFGTAHHPAQPFMRPAWDANQKPSYDSIRDDLAQEIEKARKRLARKAEREAAKLRAGR